MSILYVFRYLAFHSTIMDANSSWSNASGNCPDVDTLMKHYYLPVMYTIIFVVGFVGNIISIVIYVTKMRPWKSSSIIMLNLAITDLLYMFSLPFLVSYYIRGDSWTMGDFMCRFVRFGFHFNLYGSILFLTCLSIFRYVVVVYPLKMVQIQRKTLGCIACLVVWAISAVEIVPMLTMINMEVINNKTQFQCDDPLSIRSAEVYLG
uniref:Oxoglutarate (alpha-ketoglutarate) receptor 1a, tandem duplicate 2 n=1 Tax=Scleropages formosus TaxID=113540 RepID=A0A8C9RCJ9_SCLFO